MRAHPRGIIFRNLRLPGNCLAVHCNAEGRPVGRSEAKPRTGGRAGAALSGRIQQPGSRLPPSAASTRSRWMKRPSAIAALQTSGLRPTEPALDRRLFPLAGQRARCGARSLLPDWQAPDSAAPAADNIRRIWQTMCSWPKARIWPPEHDNAAPSLCDQPLPACREQEEPTLIGRSAMGQGGLWISARSCAGGRSRPCRPKVASASVAANWSTRWRKDKRRRRS
jgi:hypothetical protein